MNEWVCAIAAAVLFITLVQFVAYYYLMRGRSSADVWSSSTDGPGARPAPGIGPTDSPVEGVDHDENARRCSRCGAPNENEPIFTYCRNCGEQLT